MALRLFRLFIALFLISLLPSNTPLLVFAQPISPNLLQDKLQMGCSYLIGLYNSSLGLVRTSNNSRVYYIASDNLLTITALSSCKSGINQTITQSISQSISSCCDSGHDRMHEALLGIQIPLPIHTSTTLIIANSSQGRLYRNINAATAGGNYTVLWEYHNATGTFPDCTYADTTAYTALELKRTGNSTGVQHEIDCLSVMYDGKGLVDEPYKDGTTSEHGIYQTFKLALYLYALLKTGSYYYGQEDTLLRLQGVDGGFHTSYDQAGTYARSEENAETTSIAIIALSAFSQSNPFIPTFPSIPLWIIVLYAVLVAASAGTVLLLLYWDKRKLRRMPPI